MMAPHKWDINLILMLWEKSGTYHQIWIQNNLGFMVLDLMYVPYIKVLYAGKILEQNLFKVKSTYVVSI